jgi:hypothetical protein
MPCAALLLALLTPAALADFVPCEQRGSMWLEADGQHVGADFLGSCGDVAYYDQALSIQVELDEGWSVVGTHWDVVGSEQVEVDGELVEYRAFEQLVSCPGEGAWDFRVAWMNDDGVETWFGDRFDCESPGACSSAPVGPALLLCLLAGLWVVPTRRRGDD